MKNNNFRLFFFLFMVLFITTPVKLASSQQKENATLVFLDNGNIYSYKTATEGRETIVSGNNYLGFGISETGNWILAYKKNNYFFDMDIINVNTNEIISFEEIHYSKTHRRDNPQISPDDSKIVYKVGTPSTTIIASINGTILSEFSFQMNFPHWGKDSESLYYFRFIENELTFSKFDILSKKHIVIYSFPNNDDEEFVYPFFVYFSKNSSYVAIASQRLGTYEGELIFVSKDGDLKPIRKRIYGCTLFDDGLGDWSPDGKTFAYHQPSESNYKGSSSLIIFTPIEGSPNDGLTTHKGDPIYAFPRWSPDGKYLSYVNQNGVYGIYNLEENKFTKLEYNADDTLILSDPSDCLPGGNIKGFDSFWSPKGNWLILSAYQTKIVNITTQDIIYIEGASNARWLGNSDWVNIPDQEITPHPEITPSKNNPTALSANWISYVGQDHNIWLIKPDGSENHQITTDADSKSNYQNLNWSPNGRKLAFQKYYREQFQYDIFVYDLYQGTLIKIVDKSQTAGGFDWYQDSEHIIFDRPAIPIEATRYGASCTVGYKDNDGLFIVTIATGEMKQILSLPGNLPIRNPKVSPDNKSIIFDFLQPVEQNLDQFIMRIDIPEAFKEIIAVQSDCDWNPNGTKIVCGTWDGTVAESEFRPLSIFSNHGDFQNYIPSRLKAFDNSPLWSPSGEMVAFNTTDSAGSYADGPCGGGEQPVDDWPFFIPFQVDVYFVTSNSRKTIADGRINGWSPDSSQILVSSNNREDDHFIYIVDIEALGSTLLAKGFEATWQPIKIPPAVKELSIKPGKYQNEFNLSWTYFIDPSLSFEIDKLDIRFNSDPITDSNWSESDILLSVDIDENIAMPWEITVTNKEISPYKNWYFSARVKSHNVWSPISYVRFIDTGFRVNTDGYPFYNYTDINYDDITQDIIKDMFSSDLINICKRWTLYKNIDCELKDTVEQWRIDVNQKMAAGRCLGISATSQYYFNNQNLLYSKHNVKNLNNLDVVDSVIPSNIRQDIARYHVVQWAQPYWYDYRIFRPNITPFNVIDILQTTILNSNTDPVILFVESGNWSHAVVPISLTEVSPGFWRIWTYDSVENHKGFILEVDNNSPESLWAFYDSNYKVMGNKNTSSLFTVPLSYIYAEQKFPSHIAPYDDYSWFFGKVKTLISDPYGKQIGYVADYFINSITGAFAVPTTNSINETSMPTFVLPSNQEYTILIEGLAESKPNVGGLSYYSQNKVISINEILLSEDVQETITINLSNNSFAYDNALNQTFSLSYSSDDDEESLKINIYQITLPANNHFHLTYDEINEIVEINQSSAGSYFIEAIYTSEKENKKFTSNQIDLHEGETHFLNINIWKAGEYLKLEIDENSDGVIDQTRKLRNNPLSLDNSGTRISGYLLLSIGLLIILLTIVGFFFVIKSDRR
jgi:Tol biopolymer transport system component